MHALSQCLSVLSLSAKKMPLRNTSKVFEVGGVGRGEQEVGGHDQAWVETVADSAAVSAPAQLHEQSRGNPLPPAANIPVPPGDLQRFPSVHRIQP